MERIDCPIKGCYNCIEVYEKPTPNSCILIEETFNFHKRLINNLFISINWIYISTLTVSILIIISKAIGATEFEWNDIKFPLNLSWVIFAILTLIHLFLGLQLAKSVQAVIDSNCKKLRNNIYLEIMSGENIFIRGFNPNPIITTKMEKIFFLKYKKDDFAYWLRAIISLLVFVAAIDYENILKTVSIGIYLNIFSAYVGSKYIISFYRLAY